MPSGDRDAKGNGNNNDHNGNFTARKAVIDERDVFISWIRGEFAAANAIIDALCNHLRSVGDAGEYESVLACIQQRRYNWIAILQMQHYYSVADVALALRQVASAKNRQHGNRYKKGALRSFEGPVQVNNASPEVDPAEIQSAGEKELLNNGVFVDAIENGQSINDQSSTVVTENRHGGPKERESGDSELAIKQEDDGYRQAMVKTTESFVANELVDGQSVNITKGLKLHENIFDSSELSQVTSFICDLQVAGQQGKLRGQTFITSKRPMKGNGREMIQFGVPIIVKHLKDQAAKETPKDVVEPIPTILDAIIDRLIRWNLISGNRRPDSCIINFFNEGDYSQPHMHSNHFERPFYTLPLLSECTMVFGRVISMDHPGDYSGSFKHSLVAGSLLAMQGNSVDIARHSICSSPQKRIIITFVKVQPKKPHDFSSSRTSIPHPPSLSVAPWPVGQQLSGNTPVNPLSFGRATNPATFKHYNIVPASGVLSIPLMPQHGAIPSIQPLFTGIAGRPASYPPLAVLASGWSAVPRPPRMRCSGTGVFLPCGESVSDPGWPITLSQQPQGLLFLSQMSPRSDTPVTDIACAESLVSSYSTSRLLKSNQLDRSMEKQCVVSSSQYSLSSRSSSNPAKVASNEATSGSPKLDSNGNGARKEDQLKRNSSDLKTNGNTDNSITEGATSGLMP